MDAEKTASILGGIPGVKLFIPEMRIGNIDGRDVTDAAASGVWSLSRDGDEVWPFHGGSG
jgi:hypothetical protein